MCQMTTNLEKGYERSYRTGLKIDIHLERTNIGTKDVRGMVLKGEDRRQAGGGVTNAADLKTS